MKLHLGFLVYWHCWAFVTSMLLSLLIHIVEATLSMCQCKTVCTCEFSSKDLESLFSSAQEKTDQQTQASI